MAKIVSVELRARVEGFTAGMRKAKSAVDDLTKADVPKAARGFADLSNKAAVAGAAVALGLGVAVKRFADFDSAMSAVRANTGATGVELDGLREAALRLGADSQFSASEAAQGINELGKAGIETADILGGGLKGSLDLAAAGQIGVAEAAETTATALQVFKLEGSQATHVADLLAAGASKAQGGVSDMALALDYAGGISASLGVSIEETAGTLAFFASQGIIGEKAGTSYRAMLLSLTAPSAIAATKMKELGISVFDAQGNFIGMEGAANELQRVLGPLDQKTRTAALGQIFGNESINAAIKLYEGGGAAVRQWTKDVDATGFAAEQAAALTDNLKGDIERLGGAFDSVLIGTGSGANDSLRSLTQGLTTVIEKVGQVPGPLLLAGGALTAVALIVPKGIITFREYRATLDSVGLSMEKIAARGPKAAKGVNAATAAAKGLGVALAVVGAAAVATSLDGRDALGVEGLTRDLLEANDAVDVLNKRIGGVEEPFFAAGKTINDFGDVLRFTFDPGTGDKIDNIGGSIISAFGGTNVSSIAQAGDRLTELDAALSGLVGSGQAESAATLFQQVSAEADRQGITVDQLKAKLPQYGEALASVSNSQTAAAGSGAAVAGTMADLEAKAADAETALENLRNAIDGLGSPMAQQRAANRDYQAAIDAASASIKENGRTLNANTEKGRANEAALDVLRQATLDKVNADYTMTGSTAVATKTMQKGREAFVDAAVAAGSTRKEAEKLATKLELIPDNVAIAVKQTGAQAAGADIDAAARRRTAVIGVRYVVEGRLPNGGVNLKGGLTRAEGGPIYGPGTKTSDSVPLWASAGEYMQKAAAVDKYGVAFMDAVNNLRFPAGLARGYATGGLVQAQYAPRMQYVATIGGGSAGQAGTTYAPTFNVSGADAHQAAQRAMREFEYRVVAGL